MVAYLVADVGGSSLFSPAYNLSQYNDIRVIA
jgi:hypothetical protein